MKFPREQDENDPADSKRHNPHSNNKPKRQWEPNYDPPNEVYPKGYVQNRKSQAAAKDADKDSTGSFGIDLVRVNIPQHQR
ncbi:MAG: hypothetical protein N2C14_07965, partial [Planctomycetales bacterium]